MLYGGRDHGQLENLWLGHIGCERREYDAIKKKKKKLNDVNFDSATLSRSTTFHSKTISTRALSISKLVACNERIRYRRKYITGGIIASEVELFTCVTLFD